MCESTAYLITDKGEQKIMENVVYMKPENDQVYLADLLGEQKIVKGLVKEIRLIDHKIIISEK
ncbi:Predicted RNA-binding protein [Anaerovirgula multivorans]|uniref:Predicted RNA-binding protein n=1 Tax=Anaerovirgula multivorans TaxID=312168 RepID=A0A239KI52_9FIRM|nr:CooT family nickel-binding protein [Anaerovirgula multivorans]SNT16834.1 Predicted RNA-binding protein [Anaerovirgula multivorans]